MTDFQERAERIIVAHRRISETDAGLDRRIRDQLECGIEQAVRAIKKFDLWHEIDQCEDIDGIKAILKRELCE